MRRLLAVAAIAVAAPPLAAQDTLAWRLTVTPFAGRAEHGRLVDHEASLRRESPFTPGAELIYGERTRLGLGAGGARGVRLDARLGARWSAFLEASHGRARLEYVDSVGTSLSTDPSGGSYTVFRRAGDATVGGVALGVARLLPRYRALPLETTLGAGASLRRVSLPRERFVCPPQPSNCFTFEPDPWESRYFLPGVAGSLTVRVPVGEALGIEARTLVTLGRARTPSFATEGSGALGDVDVPDARWVRGIEYSLGLSSRVFGPPGGATPDAGRPHGGRSRLIVTPLAGLALSSPLLDRTHRRTQTFEVSDGAGGTRQATSERVAVRRLALGDAAVAGARVELRVAGWAPFLEAALGRAPFQFVDSSTVSFDGQAPLPTATSIGTRAPARVAAFVLGATRAFALPRRDLALDLGAGAALHRYGLESRPSTCPSPQDVPGLTQPCFAGDGWEETYWAPGGAGVLALRWAVAPRVAVEGRATLTLVRAATGNVEPSANETALAYPDEPDLPDAQWVRGAWLALGVSLYR